VAVVLGRGRVGGRGAGRPGSPPVAAGRSWSADQADQEPGYRAASTPMTGGAAIWWAASTPAPQCTPTRVAAGSPVSTPRAVNRDRSWSGAAKVPSAVRLPVVAALTAPGMCPARGSTGSLSPRYRSAARASSSIPSRTKAAAWSAVSAGRWPELSVTSPGSGSTSPVPVGRPAAVHAPGAPSRMRTSASPAQRSPGAHRTSSTTGGRAAAVRPGAPSAPVGLTALVGLTGPVGPSGSGLWCGGKRRHAHAASTASVSCDFVANTSTSSDASSSSAGPETAGIWSKYCPSGRTYVRPLARSASRCAPRATSTTR
jgi:hypothetical protein